MTDTMTTAEETVAGVMRMVERYAGVVVNFNRNTANEEVGKDCDASYRAVKAAVRTLAEERDAYNTQAERLAAYYVEACHTLHDNYHVGTGAEDWTDCPESSCVVRFGALYPQTSHDARQQEQGE